jgi:S-adenosylmethionine:tRNA ribosyltransferase-isomerase
VPDLATDLFDYELPPRLIAQTPAAKRDDSRLLVVSRSDRRISHHSFSELPKFIRPTDVLFRNNAAVLPARLHAFRPTGGEVECFLLAEENDPAVWRCLIRPGRRLPIGATFAEKNGEFTGTVVAKADDGTAQIRFSTTGKESIVAVANRIGEVPLPPYINRADGLNEASTRRESDVERYQTVYANMDRQVAVAAPTAGLHFTPELLQSLAASGTRFAELTLHVGLGTFKPITASVISEHVIHREIYEIPLSTQRALFDNYAGRRIAIGTTSVRTIEDFLTTHSQPIESSPTWVAEAGIFIYPPKSFRGVDGLITNFHQPRSTLLCLVAAFLAPRSTDGIEWLREIYREAVKEEYRFFSYGDAMLIV